MTIWGAINRQKNRYTVRSRLFISYLLILFIPLLIGSIAYRRAYGIVERKELEARSMLLGNYMAEMDNMLRRVDSLLLEINQNNAVKKLLYLQTQPGVAAPEAALVYEANKVLSSYAVSSGFGSNFALYFSRPDLVFCSNSIVYGCERFYDIAFSYEGMDYRRFQEEVLGTYRFRGAVGGMDIVDKRTATNPRYISKIPGIVYISSLPLMGERHGALGTFVFHLTGDIFQILNETPESGHSYSLIADADFHILAGNGGWIDGIDGMALSMPERKGSLYREMDGQKMLVTYLRSDYNDWYYVSLSPMDLIMQDLGDLQTTIIVITLTIVLVGLSMALLLSKRNSKPFEMALVELQRLGRNAQDGSFSGIMQGIASLFQDNRELTDTLDKQRTIMRVSFFEKLLHGEYAGAESIASNARYLELDIHGANFCVVVLMLVPSAQNMGSGMLLEHDILQIFSEHLSRRQEGMRVYTHSLSTDQVCLLMCFDSGDTQECRGLLERGVTQLLDEIQTMFSTQANCAVGGFGGKPEDVSQSFTEACIAADFIRQTKDAQQVVFYEEVGLTNLGYFYPNEMENKLKNLIAGDNAAGMHETLNYLYAENFVNRKITRYMEYCLFVDLHTSLVKINHELGLSWHVGGLFHLKPEALDIEAEFRFVRETFEHLLELHAQKPKEAALIVQIETYIREHYHDSEMSVSAISQMFFISESYFSQYFKQKTGQMFSKYLETLRINEACHLIKDSAMNIDEIALAVGYTNTLSFRRAFKKVIGVTPSAYRQ